MWTNIPRHESHILVDLLAKTKISYPTCYIYLFICKVVYYVMLFPKCYVELEIILMKLTLRHHECITYNDSDFAPMNTFTNFKLLLLLNLLPMLKLNYILKKQVLSLQYQKA